MTLESTEGDALTVRAADLRVQIYRQRADELRALAQEALADENRRVLLRLAESYERMAHTLASPREALSEQPLA